MVSLDYSLDTANYILDNKVGLPSGHSTGRYTQWDRYYKRHLNKAVQKFRKLADGSYNAVTRRAPTMVITSKIKLPTGDSMKLVQRVVHAKENIPRTRRPHRGYKKRKLGRLSCSRTEWYGI